MSIKLGKTSDSRTRGKAKQQAVPEEISAIKNHFPDSDADFIAYLFNKGLSSGTVSNYVRDCQKFTAWLRAENVPLEAVSYADVLHFIQGRKGKVKQRTQGVTLNSLKHFFTYLLSIGIITENPTTAIRIRGIKRRTLYEILSKQELEALYNDFEFKTDEKQRNQNWYKVSELSHKRNKVMIGLLIYQGITAKELADLELKDLKLREGKVFIPGSRRSNERELSLQAGQIMDLMEYQLKDRLDLLALTGKQTEKLIISAGSGYNIHNTLSKLIKSLHATNSKVTSLKQIRTSVITHWLKLHNLRQVQYMAGHRYVSSTEQYLINDLDGLQEDITKYHPIG